MREHQSHDAVVLHDTAALSKDPGHALPVVAGVRSADARDAARGLPAAGRCLPSEIHQIGPITKTVVNGRPFGEWPADEITRELLEAFREKRARVAANRNLALLRALFNWAVLAELVAATPFKVGTVAAVKLVREEARTRRLEPGEDVQLLIHAGRLRDLITAALETGCRQGELLSLQWAPDPGARSVPAGREDESQEDAPRADLQRAPGRPGGPSPRPGG
jgi:hypothetical protein